MSPLVSSAFGTRDESGNINNPYVMDNCRSLTHLRAGLVAFVLTCPAFLCAQNRGIYFQPIPRAATPLPTFQITRPLLPSPVYEEQPLWIECYWKAWELAFRNFHDPAKSSGFPSQFIDAAFNANIFLWDTGFMSMFANMASPLVPGIGSLDNFYAKQHASGEICREINRTTGEDFREWVNRENLPLFSRWGYHGIPGAVNTPVRYVGRPAPTPNPDLTLDALNNPVLSWAELESYRVTGDSARLSAVFTPQLRYYRALQNCLRQGNGLYVTDWASMDNSPRNPYLEGGGQGVDISAQMVMFGRDLSIIAKIVGADSLAPGLLGESDSLTMLINELMWDGKERWYVDRTVDGSLVPVRTIAAFWTLLAGVAPPERVKELVHALRDTLAFARVHPVPTVPANETGYVPIGGYWRGAVWAPTNMMVVRGLERNGENELARQIALKHVDAVAQVYRKTGTIWENYAADALEPGRHADSTLVVKDMVGWSGLGPILFLLEFGVGLKPDAPHNRLVWELRSPRRVGCERYRFAGHVVDLLAVEHRAGTARSVSITSDGPFVLRVICEGSDHSYPIPEGTSTITLGP